MSKDIEHIVMVDLEAPDWEDQLAMELMKLCLLGFTPAVGAKMLVDAVAQKYGLPTTEEKIAEQHKISERIAELAITKINKEVERRTAMMKTKKKEVEPSSN